MKTITFLFSILISSQFCCAQTDLNGFLSRNYNKEIIRTTSIDSITVDVASETDQVKYRLRFDKSGNLLYSSELSSTYNEQVEKVFKYNGKDLLIEEHAATKKGDFLKSFYSKYYYYNSEELLVKIEEISHAKNDTTIINREYKNKLCVKENLDTKDYTLITEHSYNKKNYLSESLTWEKNKEDSAKSLASRTTFLYSRNGNKKLVRNILYKDTSTETWTYDSRNQLSSVHKNDGGEENFSYFRNGLLADKYVIYPTLTGAVWYKEYYYYYSKDNLVR